MVKQQQDFLDQLQVRDDVMPVDEIVAMIPDRNQRFKDPKEAMLFTYAMEEIFTLLDEEADAQGVSRYDDQKRIIFVFEFYRLFDRTFGKERKNGENVFRSHLLDTVRILISKGGFRGLGKLLTMGHHDSVEDGLDDTKLDGEEDAVYYRRLSRGRHELYASLIDTTDYRHLLPGYDEEQVKQVASEVRTGVKGMTKLKRVVQGKDLTDPATFEAFLKAIEAFPITGVFKPCDVVSNGRSYKVHLPKKQEKKLAIASRYLTVAERYGLTEIARTMVDQRVGYLNPTLQSDYQDLLNDRKRNRLDPVANQILAKFYSPDGAGFVRPVVSIDFKLMDLYDVTTSFRGKKDVANAKLSDLPIDTMNPMFEVVVLTSCQNPNPTDADRRAAMSEAISYVRGAFGSGSLLRFDEKMPEVGSDLEYRGASVTVFDKKLGGQIRFRFNDANREARSKRGVYAPYGPSKSLEAVRQAIHGVLNPGYRQMVLGDDVFGAFEKRMAPQNIGVYTNKGDYRLFPDIATVFDFAASVSPEVFIGMQGAGMKFSVTSGKPFAPTSVVDKLVSGAMYEIDTCLKVGETFNDQVSANPKWYRFCEPVAEGYLRKFLRRLDIVDKTERAKAVLAYSDDYLDELSAIYKVDREWILDAIRIKAKPRAYPDDKIFADIVSGVCDPLLAIASRLEVTRGTSNSRSQIVDMSGVHKNFWEFRVVLEDAAGSSADFFVEFSKEVGISIYSHRSQKGREGEAYVYCVFDLEKEGISVRKLFYQMLSLSFKYKIELTRNPFMPLSGRDLIDTEGGDISG